MPGVDRTACHRRTIVVNPFSDLIRACPPLDLTRRKTRKYMSQPLESAGLEGKLSEQQQEAYMAGRPLEPRISIE